VGEIRCCELCQLAFTHQTSAPESPATLYNDAYKGRALNIGMQEYHKRTVLKEQRKKGNIAPETMGFWGVRGQAIRWLKRNVPEGAVVLEVGSGMGYFLTAARKNGLTPVGLDVAEEAVNMLEDDGFTMWHGTVDSIPCDWQQPAVCVSFFVLHHLADPIGFLTTIRDKFPKAYLLVAAWNRFPLPLEMAPAGLPPRTLTWWSPHALQKAVEKAGYQVDMVVQSMEHEEFGLPKVTPHGFSDWALSTGHYRLFSVYHAIKPKIFWPWKFLKRLRGKSSSILVLGKPKDSPY
jgi:hypothetical protein